MAPHLSKAEKLVTPLMVTNSHMQRPVNFAGYPLEIIMGMKNALQPTLNYPPGCTWCGISIVR